MSFIKPISSFKIDNMFDAKDPIPSGPRLRVFTSLHVYLCVGCNACYVGETEPFSQ